MNKLASMIQKASQQYYSDGTSPYTDEEFDRMVGQLKTEDPSSPLLETGHGYDISKTSGTKVKHKYGLVGSLDKCHSWIEIPRKLQQRFIDHPVIYALKLDGLSVVLYYNDGKFSQAVTRGDGTIGLDITDKVIHILTSQLGFVPEIDSPVLPRFTGAIRGEILMSDKNFERFKELHPEAKNSRNSAAGIINNKELSSDLKFLNLIVYRITGIESEIISPWSKNKGYKINYFEILQELLIFYVYNDEHHFNGCVPSEYVSLNKTPDRAFEDAMARLKDWWYVDWPADGIVISSNEVTIIGDEIVYDSIAYKYPSEVKESTVIDILWDMSKTNYLIPRIQIEPIEISGSTVQFCTGIHAQAIQSCGVGPGSRIKITKANEIIPQMLEVINKNPIKLPEICPDCGSHLFWNGVHLQCKNRQCKNQQRQDVLCWFNALAPLDGLGDTLILKYMEEIFGTDISVEKIYANGKLVNDSNLVQKGLFVKAYNKLLTGPFSIEDAIRALNIPRFGDITATKCTKFAKEFKEFTETGKISEKLKALGTANYESLVENADKLSRLGHLSSIIDWDASNIADRGEVCITGKLSVKRSTFESELKSAGFTVSNSVKKTTSYLITDDPNSGSSKNAAANKYGVTKISEELFRKTVLIK